jgi:hypothetical protein
MGVKAEDLQTTQRHTNMLLIKDDNIDTHVDPEPQIKIT